MDVALSMFPGATISGRVTAEGEAQFNTQVQAFSITYENGFQVLRPWVSKTTDDRGDYRLFFLPPGEYFIAAMPRQSARPALTAPATAPTSTSTQPAERAVRTFFPRTSDVAAAVPVVARGGEELSGIDITIRTETTYRVSGEIRSSIPINAILGGQTVQGNPMVGATVGFALHDPNVPDDSGGTSVGNVTLRPSGNGFSAPFEITGVLPGSYDWRASVNETLSDGTAQPATAIVPLEVRNRDIAGVVLDIHRTVEVKGNVTIDGQPPGQNKVRVSLQVEGSSAKRPGYQTTAARVMQADAQDGSFNIPGAGIGRYRVMIGEGLAPNLYVEDVRQGAVRVFDSGFDVGIEPPAPILVMLRSGAGRMEGVVQDAAKKPVAGATVALVPPQQRRQNRMAYRSAVSDANGRFVITNAAPGGYKLFAWSSIPSGAYFNATFLSRYEDGGKPVNIDQASTVNAALTASFK